MASAAHVQIPAFQKRDFKMRKSSTVLAMGLSMWLLVGCSSKPDVGDVEVGLKALWAPCTLVKPTSFKKTNGVDRGATYQMAITYKLEVVQDVAEEDIWTTKIPKAITPTTTDHMEFIKQQEELNAPMRAARQHIDQFYASNCPAPVTIYFQRLFGANPSAGFGRALKKGESSISR
jgi:hypothetical protein